MSYGGSSLIANWALIAVLLRFTDQARRPAPAAAGRHRPTDAMTQVVASPEDTGGDMKSRSAGS